MYQDNIVASLLLFDLVQVNGKMETEKKHCVFFPVTWPRLSFWSLWPGPVSEGPPVCRTAPAAGRARRRPRAGSRCPGRRATRRSRPVLSGALNR